ncbi:uncharacterized protein LOC116612845 [Nematostella vectensis]|uniref:uncharacterized protein LOC116612845 n=1 Tax=Nematostella vectensis TaxID=45351 RepID=UPI002077907E|nr:uncharacterized protein LOC116612845 [Nematostella vectensis]
MEIYRQNQKSTRCWSTCLDVSRHRIALKKTAEDYKADYHTSVIQTVGKSFYVDDCLHSTPTEAEAVRLATDLRELLAGGGFRLTKSERATSVKDLDFDPQLREREHWEFSGTSIYDPLGFVFPSTLPSKAILQDLCRQGLGWDDEIPDAAKAKWETRLQDLPKLEGFSIPRSFKHLNSEEIEEYEQHHFSDASSTGYGAVSYLRQIYANGKSSCFPVMAESRLAPLKAMTIPRIELSATVLATCLDKMITQEIDLPLARSTFWTDSTCVIRFIENREKRFQFFVANRVAAILDQSDPTQWRYVDTANNPADKTPRGMSVDRLLQNERWTQGPAFLGQAEETCPQRPASICEIQPDDPEVKKNRQSLGLCQKKKTPSVRYSTSFPPGQDSSE